MRPSSNSTATSRASTSLTRPRLPRGIPGSPTAVSTASPIFSISAGRVRRCGPPARFEARASRGKRAPPRRPPTMRSAMAGRRLLDWSCRLDIASRRSDPPVDGPTRPGPARCRLARRAPALSPCTVSTTEPPLPTTARSVPLSPRRLWRLGRQPCVAVDRRDYADRPQWRGFRTARAAIGADASRPASAPVPRRSLTCKANH
jgi:hypothetical protein